MSTFVGYPSKKKNCVNLYYYKLFTSLGKNTNFEKLVNFPNIISFNLPIMQDMILSVFFT